MKASGLAAVSSESGILLVALTMSSWMAAVVLAAAMPAPASATM
jgi:hypothetical protein